MIYALWRVASNFKRSFFKRIKLWHYRNRPPPFKYIPGANPLGNDHGEHNISFVSRHDIAECGLKCPNCNKMPADRGDFSAVIMSQYGEAVNCSCGQWLVAAPDTDHGDDKLEYDEKVFHKFKRITEEQATRERYGEDVTLEEGQMKASRMKLADVGDHLAKGKGKVLDPHNGHSDTNIMEPVNLPEKEQ